MNNNIYSFSYLQIKFVGVCLLGLLVYFVSKGSSIPQDLNTISVVKSKISYDLEGRAYDIKVETIIHNGCTWEVFTYADQMDVEHSPKCTNFHSSN